MCLQSDLNNCYNNISMRLLHTERHILLGRCAAGGWRVKIRLISHQTNQDFVKFKKKK